MILITTQCFAPKIGGIESLMTGMAEAMAQTGGVLLLNTVSDPENYLTFFMKIDNVNF